MPLFKNRSKTKTMTHKLFAADGHYYDPSELQSYFVRKPTVWEIMLEMARDRNLAAEARGIFMKETNKELK